MATITRRTTVRITRDERAALWARAQNSAVDLDGIEHLLNPPRAEGRDRVIELVATAQIIVGLLEQIGWQEKAERDQYVITLDQSAVDWLTAEITAIGPAPTDEYDEHDLPLLTAVLEAADPRRDAKHD